MCAFWCFWNHKVLFIVSENSLKSALEPIAFYERHVQKPISLIIMNTGWQTLFANFYFCKEIVDKLVVSNKKAVI